MTRRAAALLAAAFALAGAPTGSPAAAAELPDWLQLGLRGYADLRLVRTPEERNWTAGGLGKVRYGGSEGGSRTGVRPGELSLAGSALLPGGLQAVAHVRAEPEQRTVVDLVEAYLRWRPVSTSGWRWAVKAGAFFPPVSLENDGVAWTSRYSLTPSAINSWVGEELRSIGAEGRLEWRGETDHLEAVASVFGWNDPAGTMIAYGGWHFTDRPTGLTDRLQIPNEVQFHRGRVPPGYTDVPREIDDRAGYYAGASWRHEGLGRIAVLRYDNRARPDAFRKYFAWTVNFWSLGLSAEPLPGLTVLAQAMDGNTIVTPSAVNHSHTDFRAAYLLASLDIDRWRLTLRGDLFGTRERSPAPRVELSEHGTALTAAVSYRLADGVRLTGEWLRIDSRRDQRTAVGLPADAVESQLQLALRIYF